MKTPAPDKKHPTPAKLSNRKESVRKGLKPLIDGVRKGRLGQA